MGTFNHNGHQVHYRKPKKGDYYVNKLDGEIVKAKLSNYSDERMIIKDPVTQEDGELVPAWVLQGNLPAPVEDLVFHGKPTLDDGNTIVRRVLKRVTAGWKIEEGDHGWTGGNYNGSDVNSYYITPKAKKPRATVTECPTVTALLYFAFKVGKLDKTLKAFSSEKRTAVSQFSGVGYWVDTENAEKVVCLKLIATPENPMDEATITDKAHDLASYLYDGDVIPRTEPVTIVTSETTYQLTGE